ncbi:flavin reductase family protein [Microbacterium sp. NPDC077663]|uniref:flavin reductase family protein n=1 Tax=Microbacterium sp. NPDC077663 TaxID=3364189 RepID=UPI0037C822FA
MTTATARVLDAQDLRRAFAHYPSGVAALSAHIDGEDQVLVASSFTVGISMSPALVLFAVQHSSTTWPLLRGASRLGISVLSQEHAPLCRQLASKDRDTRWQGVDVIRTPGGAILLEGAALTFESTIHSEFTAGDHDVIVLEVSEITTNDHIEPLVFHGSRFRAIA